MLDCIIKTQEGGKWVKKKGSMRYTDVFLMRTSKKFRASWMHMGCEYISCLTHRELAWRVITVDMRNGMNFSLLQKPATYVVWCQLQTHHSRHLLQDSQKRCHFWHGCLSLFAAQVTEFRAHFLLLRVSNKPRCREDSARLLFEKCQISSVSF